MERLSIEQLDPGMILARTIFLGNGKILYPKKTKLSKTEIHKFKEIRLPAVYVTSIPDSVVPEPVSDTTRSELTNVLMRIETDLHARRQVNLSSCENILTVMIDEILKTPMTLPVINDIRVLDDYLTSHTVNICISAVKVGLLYNYNYTKLLELALGAFLHDIGMTKIPADIVNRIGGLTHEEVRTIQTHPKIGFDLLRQIEQIPKTTPQVAYQHHERYNGKGYPKKLAGTEIIEYARIVAAVDSLDAMTTEKLYRKAKPVPEAIQYLKSQAGIEYDPRVVNAVAQIYGL